MTRWQSLGKLTIPAILLAILYHRPGNWAFEPTGRAHCSCSFREMSFHELTVELSAFDASLRNARRDSSRIVGDSEAIRKWGSGKRRLLRYVKRANYLLSCLIGTRPMRGIVNGAWAAYVEI